MGSTTKNPAMASSGFRVTDWDKPMTIRPCECSSCDWKGTFADTSEIGDCSLTPGDPSPAGRCPECDSLAYVTLPSPDLKAQFRQLLAAGLTQAEVLTMLGEDQMEKRPFVSAFIEGAPDRSDLGLSDGDVEYDAIPLVSESDDGAFVMAWLWVSNEAAGIEDADEEEEED